MSEMFIVLRREFLERVRSRGFLIGTILIPVFLGGLFIGPALIGAGGGGERKLVVVDQAPAGIGEAFARTLSTPPAADDRSADTYRVERVAGPIEAVREGLNRRVVDESIDGYVVLPADLLERGSIDFRARNVSSFTTQRAITRAATQAVQQARLSRAGLEVTEVTSLLKPVTLSAARVTAKGEAAGDAESTFWLAYLSGFLVYFLVFFYGINVMRSVLEEKTNRIAEVIISSMRAVDLMTGKILGVGLVALLQVAIWIALGALGVSRSAMIAKRFGVSPDAFSFSGLEPWVLAVMVAFFLLGFFLYASLFAAVGAAVNSDQEAQQYQQIVFAPLIAALIFMISVINDPAGATATKLGLIPFTSPIIMPMRMAASPVPTLQIVASLASLAVSVVIVAWLAGKIYRVGILSTGKKPSLKELGRWLRAA